MTCLVCQECKNPLSTGDIHKLPGNSGIFCAACHDDILLDMLFKGEEDKRASYENYISKKGE